MALAAFLLTLFLLTRGYHFGPLIPTSVMAVAALISEKQSVRMSSHLQLSVAFLPALLSAVTLGPLSTMLVALVSLIGDLHLIGDLQAQWQRWAIWTSSRCFILGFASLGAVYVGPAETLAAVFTAVVLASLIVVSGESIIGSLTVAIRGVKSPVAHFIDTTRLMSFGLLVYVPVIAGLAYVYKTVSPWAVMLFIGPAIAAQKFFVLYRDQRRTANELNRAVEKLERVNLSFATALVTALDARDHYTAGHSATVAVYARDIAAQCGFSSGERDKAHLCGLLHDIGKIGVPVGVLEKKGALETTERASIESHAEVGASILGRIEGYEEIAVAVRHHHERYEGGGYPDRIGGERVPLMARIVAVADAYSAMTSERPYRVALSSAEARARLGQEAGKQFDPRIVDAFIAVLDRAGEIYASGTHSDFENELAVLMKLEPERSCAVSG
ncbi:MAG: HD-GYP domain-containing protein [Gaiellaceae bacterium]